MKSTFSCTEKGAVVMEVYDDAVREIEKLREQLSDSDALLRDFEDKLEGMVESKHNFNNKSMIYFLTVAERLISRNLKCKHSGLSMTLSREQIESSIVDKDPLSHLSRIQVTLIIAAILETLEAQCTRRAGVYDQSDSSIIEHIAGNIISVMGAEEDCLYDDVAYISAAFITLVLQKSGVAYYLHPNTFMVPFSLPSDDLRLEITDEKWASCCSISFSGMSLLCVFNHVCVHLNCYYVPERSRRNYAYFFSTCYDKKLESHLLVQYDGNNCTFRLWVSGSSHVLSVLFLNTAFAVNLKESSDNRSSLIAMDSSYSHNFPKLSNYVYLLSKHDDDQRNMKNFDLASLLPSMIESIEFARNFAYKTMLNPDMLYLDSTVCMLHTFILDAISSILVHCSGFPETIVPDTEGHKLLWLCCLEKHVSTPALSDVYLYPVTPGSSPTDSWHLVPGFGLCVGNALSNGGCDFDLRAQQQLVEAELQLPSQDSTLVCRALQLLGVAPGPSINILGLFDALIFPENARDILFDLMLAQQRKVIATTQLSRVYYQELSEAETSSWKKSIEKSSLPEVEEGIDLSALDVDLDSDVDFALQKAAMVGELNRRLTFHRENSSGHDIEEGVSASRLLEEVGEAMLDEPNEDSTLSIPCCYMLISSDMWGCMHGNTTFVNER